MSWRIKDWNEIYENNRTRDLKRMEWVPIPNKMDGDGYVTLLDHPNGAAHFGIWIALVEIASKSDIRGVLRRGAEKDGAIKWHDAVTLSRLSRIEVRLIEEAIPRLVDIGWLEEVTARDYIDLAATAEMSPQPAGFPQESAAVRARATRVRDERNGTERNGTEKNGRRTLSEASTGSDHTEAPSSSFSPVEIPDKSIGRSSAPPADRGAPPVLTTARIEAMRLELQEYMTPDDRKPSEPRYPAPDDAIVLQCLNAIGSADIETDVRAFLIHIRNTNGQAPGRSNGPRGYTWFPAVLKSRFSAVAPVAAE